MFTLIITGQLRQLHLKAKKQKSYFMNCLRGSVSVAMKRKANRMEVFPKRDGNWVQTSSI